MSHASYIYMFVLYRGNGLNCPFPKPKAHRRYFIDFFPTEDADWTGAHQWRALPRAQGRIILSRTLLINSGLVCLEYKWQDSDQARSVLLESCQ